MYCEKVLTSCTMHVPFINACIPSYAFKIDGYTEYDTHYLAKS